MAKATPPNKKEVKDERFNLGIDDVALNDLIRKRVEEAEEHWDKDKKLKSVRKENNNRYLSKYADEQLVDERYEEVSIDNRQFVSVRTILPFLTARVTQPEITPANDDDLSLQFAHDFEEAMAKHAERQMARAKVRLAIQDLLRGERVGVVMWRYDAAKDTVVLEHIPANTVVIGKRARLHEEPDFVQRTIKRSVGKLIQQFPDKKEKIIELFEVDEESPSQLAREYEIEENWIWLDTPEGQQLGVAWTHGNFLFGAIKDPNWIEGGKNVIDSPMIPFVFFNFLNDGSGYIDQTSYMEQSKWLQKNYDTRGQTIAENARYGGIGVPIFAKGALKQGDAAKIRFSPIQRILLNSEDVNKSFTTWQSQNLPQFVVEDKYDLRNSIDNIWGTPNIFRGEQSDNNTLGQDIIIRDQAEGRQSDPVDCIDDAMQRFYQIEAQLMYRYFNEDKYYRYIGNDGKFIKLVISQKRIRENTGIEIGIKAGTSLPIDRAQKNAQIMELLKIDRISTLVAYKELQLFDDPEEAFKLYIQEKMGDPAALLEEVDKKVLCREAEEDLQLIIGGKEPEERDDIEDEYLNYLNEYLLTDKYMRLQREDQKAAARVTEFIDRILEKAQRKLVKLSMQPSLDPLGQQAAMMPPDAAMGAGAPPVSSALPSASQIAQPVM